MVSDGLWNSYSDVSTVTSSGPDFYYPVNYPPLFAYDILATSKALQLVAPEAFARSNHLVESAIKFPSVVANLIIALLLFTELNRLNKPKIAFAAASVYLFNPALIFDISWWGQNESLCSLAILLSFILLKRRRPEWAAIAITLAVLAKPFGWPYVGIVCLEILRHFGWKRALSGLLASLAAAFVVFLPFVLEHHFLDILGLMLSQIDSMPYVSVNAHNFWWMVSGALPWVNAYKQFFGIVSYKIIGMMAFGVFYAVTLWKLWKSKSEDSLYVAGASVAFGFFMLSTHMHENHLFYFFPLFSLFAFETTALKKVYFILTATFFLNMFLHDPFLTYSLHIYDLGPRLIIPPQPDVPPNILDYAARENLPHSVLQAMGQFSLLWLIATILNAQANVLTFFYWIFALFRNGFDLEKAHWPLPGRKVVPLVIAFVFLTALPIVFKVLGTR